MISDEAKERDADTFLSIEVTDMERTFANTWACVLMLAFSVWTSMFYKFLASYTKDADSKFFEYTLYSYGFFFVWPIFQLFVKCCRCCCCCGCNKDDPEKVDDDYKAMEEMMEVVHTDHAND